MNLHIYVNHNSNSIRVDIERNGKVVERGDTIPCDRPSNVIRILHEVFNKLFTHETVIANLDEASIELTSINEDTVRNVGEW